MTVPKSMSQFAEEHVTWVSTVLPVMEHCRSMVPEVIDTWLTELSAAIEVAVVQENAPAFVTCVSAMISKSPDKNVFKLKTKYTSVFSIFNYRALYLQCLTPTVTVVMMKG